MASCKITSGFGVSCADKSLGAGGVKTKIWLMNGEDIEATFDSTGAVVTDLDHKAGTYAFLYPYEGFKNSSTTDTGAQNETGLPFYTHTVNISTLDTTGDAIAALEELVNADNTWAIVETTGGQFRLFGYSRGLTVSDSPRESGTTVEEGTSRLVTLTGQVASLPKIVLIGGTYAATKAFLEAREV